MSVFRRAALCLLVLCSLLFVNCENPWMVEILGIKVVNFDSNGGSSIKKQSLFKGELIKKPSDPTLSGFTFSAWYLDNGTFENEWDFNTAPIDDMTLYANWKAIEKTPITAVAITVTQPDTGLAPNTAASGTGNFSIGRVSWSPNDNPFDAGVQYTASVTLTAHQYYFFDLPLTTATINGNNATVVNNGTTLTLSYTFPATRAVSGISINTPPTKLIYTHGDTLDLSSLVVTLTYNDSSSDNVAFSNFASRGITVSPVNGTVLSHSIHDDQPVTITYGGFTSSAGNLTVSPKVNTNLTVTVTPTTYAYTGSAITPTTVTVRDGTTTLTLNTDYTVAYSNNTNAGTATVTISGAGNYEGSTGTANFTINKANITSAAITVTGPVKGGTPDTAATGTGDFSIGPVSWSPNNNPFMGSTAYTASVTLTANPDYAFASTLTARTINGNNATVVSNNGTTLTLSYRFPNTDAKTASDMAIKTPPNLSYTHGNTLNLSSLVVTLTYDDSTTEDVAYSSFASRGITVSPVNGTVLSRSIHDGQPVTITYGGFTQTTDNLTVNKADPTVTAWPTAATITYPAALSTSTLSGGSATPAGTFTWYYSDDEVNLLAGSYAQSVIFTPNDTDNYSTSIGSISITVNKGTPTVNWPTGLTATYGQTLADISLPNNNGTGTAGAFSWTAVNTTSVGNAGTQSHNMTFTPTDTNYNTAAQNVTVTVAKATGETVSAPSANTIGVNSVTLKAETTTNGQTVEYARSNTNAAPTSGWQSSLTFSGLTGGTTYYFFARSASNTNYEAGAASSGTAITTLQNVGITITLDVDELVDKAPDFNSNITISRTGTGGYSTTATVAITGTYDSIYWEIPGIGTYVGQSVNGTTPSITLDAKEVIYNSPGSHQVTVRVTIDGMDYQTSFRFRIVD